MNNFERITDSSAFHSRQQRYKVNKLYLLSKAGVKENGNSANNYLKLEVKMI
jgi:hypothetical protein